MPWYIILFPVVIVIIFFFMLKKKQDEIERNFQKRFAGKKILLMDKYALYVARERDGYSHFRGNGYLVLTNDELFFERQLNKMIVKIPVNSILGVDKTRRLGGQAPGKLMLKVNFKNSDGSEDAIAWKVKELDKWINTISGNIKS